MSENLYDSPRSDVTNNSSDARKLSLAQIYLSIDGRVNRKTYWLLYFLPLTLLYMAVIFIIANSPDMIWIEFAFIALIFWPSIAVQAKRWHDRDKSAWWILIGIIPIVGIWAIIENGFLSGDPTSNSYGELQDF